MKVLHVVRSDGFSGVERHITTLAAAQARAGDEVTVIGGAVGPMRRALGDDGIGVLSGDSLRGVAASIRRATRPDIVHAHMTAGELAVCLSTTAPLVVTRHFARPRGATPVGRLAGILIRRRTGAQIAVSQYVAQRIERRATVVYPGVPASDGSRAVRRPVVLVVQRLQPEKNTDIALRAFALAAPAEWTLEVVGRGPELSSLRGLAEQLGVQDRVSFLGFRDDVPALMQSASVFLAPCEIEGLGLSVLEAMAQGLPVVASRAGAHPETVGMAPSAHLFDPGAPEQAAKMLARLCGDVQLRGRYGDELAKVQQTSFTPHAQAEATRVVYQQVLA
ncbi:glycosyltransferase family 4 protein [Ornithinimicrobium sp. F0845]|uniref:glycosyltransferase family 4 protein n=1 Tax=Ornithinimicrobium sp. F0845 TaxID=2926412 RepID=UPI001FF2F5C5|nr:glycosyltransferase family 4 protein [Ornithinimicrobium sp. F0845]